MRHAHVMRGYCSLYDLIRRGARRHRCAVAVSHRGRTLTWEELQAGTEALGGALRRRAVRQGDRVVVVVESSLEYVLAVFGVVAAGAVAVPVAPDVCGDELRFVLRDTGARGVVARSRWLDAMGVSSDEVRVLVALGGAPGDGASAWCTLGRAARAAPATPTEGDDPAIILYTSGTTGRPKGVMLSHRNILANSRSIVAHLRLSARDSLVHVLPPYHALGASVLHAHMAVGARVVLEDRLVFPAKVVQTLQKERPTGFTGVPSTFYLLARRAGFLERDWSFLRYVTVGGGPMRPEALEELVAALPTTEVHVTYGQTEATARLSALEVSLFPEKIGSIGRGLPGVDLRVVDPTGRPVAPGEVGEIVVHGDSLMLGYYGCAESTAQVLCQGWLWTGDLAHVDDDGYVYVVGRRRELIKCGSHRVSPWEVEHVVAGVPGVQDVAVFGTPDALLGEALVVCVSGDVRAIDVGDVRRRCRERLPAYKVPSYYLVEPSLPSTPSGKRNYAALRERFRDLGTSAAA